MHHSVKDLTGLVLDGSEVIRYAGSSGKKSSLWEIRCKCGQMFTAVGSEFTRGNVRSCGCLRKERAHRTHGMSKHPAYAVWRSMMDRCRLPTHQAWKNYGGRGITVCPRWSEFQNFWEDMGPTYRKGLTLDRRDNEQGYTPENCHWVTFKENSRNRRSSRFIDTPWGRMTVSEASERSGVGNTTLLYRLGKGLTGNSLFVKPDSKNQFTTS